MSRKLDKKFSTRAIHVGQDPDPSTGSVVPPVHLTSTYVQEDVGIHKGFDYSRAANPTRQNLEMTVASLEGADRGVAFASGMAAFTALISTFKGGDHFVVSENVYGGTYRMMTQVLGRFGVASSWVDSTNLDEISAAITESTVALILESPTNPMMSITDIAAASQLGREHGLITAVDNTFMSPYLQRPLELGADVVYHSTTKYLGGHSDVLGGIVLTSNAKIAENLAFIQKSGGAIPSPFDCWLLSRSLKTLPVRMERHEASASHLASVLEGQSQVQKIYYPGLPSHPQHELAARQQSMPDGRNAFGGMISFDTGSMNKARNFARALEIFNLAESLGGVESLVNHPATMTHAAVPQVKRESFGLTDGLVRLSVGLEDVADLEADLLQALLKIS